MYTTESVHTPADSFTAARTPNKTPDLRTLRILEAGYRMARPRFTLHVLQYSCTPTSSVSSGKPYGTNNIVVM